jgi:hypothetical protein
LFDGSLNRVYDIVILGIQKSSRAMRYIFWPSENAAGKPAPKNNKTNAQKQQNKCPKRFFVHALLEMLLIIS